MAKLSIKHVLPSQCVCECVCELIKSVNKKFYVAYFCELRRESVNSLCILHCVGPFSTESQTESQIGKILGRTISEKLKPLKIKWRN